MNILEVIGSLTVAGLLYYFLFNHLSKKTDKRHLERQQAENKSADDFGQLISDVNRQNSIESFKIKARQKLQELEEINGQGIRLSETAMKKIESIDQSDPNIISKVTEIRSELELNLDNLDRRKALLEKEIKDLTTKGQTFLK
jgi:hypothetical protein